MNSFLITKERSELQPTLLDLEKHQGISIMAHSFIRFEACFTDKEHQRDCLFFGSKRGFDFYLEQYTLSPESELACIGKKTAEHIQNQGFKVSFVGEDSGDSNSVSKKLRIWLKDKKITFVYSDKSAKKISSALEKDQFEELVVYKTRLVPRKLERVPELVVFTSPSNVDAFFLANEGNNQTQYIAWGKTTQEALKKKGYDAVYTLKTAQQEELLDYFTKHETGN